MILGGACAGSVSEGVCLPEGELQGNLPPSEQHSQKVAGLRGFLGCSPDTQEMGVRSLHLLFGRGNLKAEVVCVL